MDKYVLGIDTWEGQGDLDEKLLKDGGVEFIITRLNSMNGGLRLDVNAYKQWNESINFRRYMYFVYNPWVSGKVNFDWMAPLVPNDCSRIMLDIEVKYSGITSTYYAQQVEDFRQRVAKHWEYEIYTGGWFTPLLAFWPEDCYYTWARYITANPVWYPKETTSVSWEHVHNLAKQTTWNPGKVPSGKCKMWQISADRLVVPGTNKRPIDIILFNGNITELDEYLGTNQPPMTWEQQITAWARTMGYKGIDPSGD